MKRQNNTSVFKNIFDHFKTSYVFYLLMLYNSQVVNIFYQEANVRTSTQHNYQYYHFSTF